MLRVVVCTILATAYVLLIIFSQKPKPFDRKHNSLDSLARRFGQPIFDPLVAKKEKVVDHEKPKNVTTSHKDDDDNKEFYDEGRLNTRRRLIALFPQLDVSPKDETIDYFELEAWIVQQAIDSLHYRTEQELEFRDKDGDGFVSFSEYFPQITEADLEKNKTGHGEAGWWMEQFKNADFDRNGYLNLYEFRDFLHPEDSRNDHIQKWLLKEKIRQLDHDNDQHLSLDEFEVGAYKTYKSYVEFETGKPALDPATVFSQLDLNKDRLLRAEELKPLFQYFSPGELAYAKYYTRYLINEADDNGDGKLSLNEMLKHDNVFYNTIYADTIHDEDGDSYHDDL